MYTTPAIKEFSYHSRHKYELANLYDTSTKTLRRWLRESPALWSSLEYDRSPKLTPGQIRMITDHLGLP